MHGRERMMKRGERPVLAGQRSLRPSDGVTPLGRQGTWAEAFLAPRLPLA